MEKIKIIKNNIFWGLILWVIGWVLGIVLFMTPAKDYMGWIITPIGTIITIWVLLKKIDREQYMCYLGVAIFWTVIAVVMDYFFNVLLFNIGASYYKLDIYIYYALTFILPLLIGVYKFRKK